MVNIRKNTYKHPQILKKKWFIFRLVGSKYCGIPKISFLAAVEVCEKQYTEREKKELKSVLTMSSYTFQCNFVALKSINIKDTKSISWRQELKHAR